MKKIIQMVREALDQHAPCFSFEYYSLATDVFARARNAPCEQTKHVRLIDLTERKG